MPALNALLAAGKPKPKPAPALLPDLAQQKAGLMAISKKYGIPFREVTH